MPRSKQPKNVARARQLRRDMTLPEKMIWNLLRKSPDGVHFRRQHSVDDYVLDFYCASAKVGFEIDGIVHDMGNQPEHDERRDVVLKSLGIEVKRIPAQDVLRSPADIADAILRYCKRR